MKGEESRIMKVEMESVKRKIDEERAEAIKTKDEVQILKEDVGIKSEESKIMKGDIETVKRMIEEEITVAKKTKIEVDKMKKEAEVAAGRTNIIEEEIPRLKEEVQAMKDETARYKEDINQKLETIEAQTTKYKATTVTTVQEERMRVDQLMEKVVGLNIDTNKVVAVGRLSFKVYKFTSMMNDEDLVYSPYFYTHLNGYKLRMRVHPRRYDKGRDSHMSVYVSICKGEYDDVLSWPCKYMITMAVINQRTNEAHRTYTISYCSKFEDCFIKSTNEDNTGCGPSSFISHEDLLSIEGLLVDESVLLNINISPPPVYIESFKIDKFKQKMAANEIIYSPYFYKHMNGYKLQLEVYPGGDDKGRGSHMSVLISISKGEYDDVLSWPCKYLITVAVINQCTNEAYVTNTISYSSRFKYNFIKPTNGDNPARGWASFISHKDLLSIEGLLVDESVLLHVAFTPPPL